MITKYTKCEVIEVKSADEKIEGNAKFSSFDHIPNDTYRTDDGYVYVKVRAISSRVNKNFDGWPVNELAGMDENDYRKITSNLQKDSSVSLETLTFTKDSSSLKSKGDYGFKTFIGRPIFIDHNNSDPKRTRGVIVDAMLHIEPSSKTSSNSYWSTAPDNHKPETWIELLLEVDAKSFPKLANALTEGKVNAVSMGCNVEYTLCSVCNNKAANVEEYCDHIKKKGTTFKTGNTSKLAYEDCYNINFFEISAVFDPADVTALFTEPVKTSSVKTSVDVPSETSDFIKANEELFEILESEREEVDRRDKQDMPPMSLEDERPFIDALHDRMSKWSEILKNKYQHEELSQVLSALDEYINFMNQVAENGINAWYEIEDRNLFNQYDEKVNKYWRMLQDWRDVFAIPQKKLQDVDLMEKQEEYDRSLSFDDYDFLMDMGVDPKSLSINKDSHRLKDANHETKELETILKSASVNKESDFITAPNKVDTLKTEKPCPIGLAGECGLDDESGRCEKCGYREPPAPLDDPDLSKAKDFDRQKEEQKDETRDETKDLIDQLKKALSKNQKRSVNSKMNENTTITLTANVEEVPSDEKLAELGWVIPEKEAGVASNTVPVAEDGQPASDRPKEQRVISDQTKPVESTTKVALGELPQLSQPNGGEASPQYKGDKNNETSGISEHQPSQMAEQYQSVKREVDKPQYADEGYTKDIKTHNPSTMPEQYQKVKKTVDKPQYSDEPGTSGISEHHAELHKSKVESPVLAAIKLADLEVELGLNDVEMKYARVAELENEDLTIVQAKYETLSKIKEAGLTKKEASTNKKLASFPSLKGVKESSVTTTGGGVPDDAIFG